MTLHEIITMLDETAKPIGFFAEKMRALAEQIETTNEAIEPAVSELLTDHLAPLGAQLANATEAVARLLCALTEPGN